MWLNYTSYNFSIKSHYNLLIFKWCSNPKLKFYNRIINITYIYSLNPRPCQTRASGTTNIASRNNIVRLYLIDSYTLSAAAESVGLVKLEHLETESRTFSTYFTVGVPDGDFLKLGRCLGL